MLVHTFAPSALPSLAAPVEGFFLNLMEFGHRIQFEVLYGCEMCPFEANF
jgi:hypothetical protein